MYNYSMITVDKFLLKLVSDNSHPVETWMTAKDARLIRSLANSINSPVFITENQSRLLVKVLKHYNTKLIEIYPELDSILDIATWSKPFRIVEQIKRIYLKNIGEDTIGIVVEYTFTSAIRKVLTTISKNIQGGVQTLSTKLAWVEFTEKNIITLLDSLKPYKFEVDEVLQNHYDKIKSWNVETECANIFYGLNLNPAIQTALAEEIDITNENLIKDRSLKYQYIVKTPLVEDSLTSLLAHRTQSKIWVDNKKYSLEELISVIKSLNRLPALVVFDTWQPEGCLKGLTQLHNALSTNEIKENIGIYFRLPNDEGGKEFNQFISEHKYNSKLDNNTQIAGVQTGKLPKFFLKDCSWEPKSVIVFGNNLRHSKTAVYSNRCDLVISYSEKMSVFESNVGWATSTWAL